MTVFLSGGSMNYGQDDLSKLRHVVESSEAKALDTQELFLEMARADKGWVAWWCSGAFLVAISNSYESMYIPVASRGQTNVILQLSWSFTEMFPS